MLKIFGGQIVTPYFASPSLKNGPFLLVLPKKAHRNALISWPGKRFSKKLTYDCSSLLNDEIPGEKVHLMSKMPVPQQFCKRKRPELALFLLVGARPSLR